MPDQGQGAIDGFLRKRRVEVETFLRKGSLVREAEGKDLQVLRRWFFAHNGFAEEAESLMREKGVLGSTRQDLDNLLKSVGLRKLPDLPDAKEGTHPLHGLRSSRPA
ncbi:MAG TPA: hypothetical protein G4O06_03965 [Dehalococcoidia bacterium]|nr:hypothetical protein [Dehalococcoidia bacterium]